MVVCILPTPGGSLKQNGGDAGGQGGAACSVSDNTRKASEVRCVLSPPWKTATSSP